jgi:predicted RNA-binding Zn-ribbon protein involved in translation (DUF1610 family)
MDTLKQFDEELKNQPEDNFGWETYDKTSGNGDWKPGELDKILSYSCPSCGGEIITDNNTAATTCPYCGNHAIITKKLSGFLRPDYVIPFQLDKNYAMDALKNFYKNKPLLPKKFASENKIESIVGIYVPFWLFDCNANAAIHYKAARVKFWSDSRYDYTKTDTYHVFREGAIEFEKVPVDGSKKMDYTLMEAIEPYDYKTMTDFASAYLSGYLADRYDVDADSAKPRANERLKRSVEKMFSETVVGYSSCIAENVNIAFSNGSVRYALMPVWMLNTKYGDKIYSFAMNGQTGKFIGNLPISWVKFWLWFFCIFISLSLIGFLILFFL